VHFALLGNLMDHYKEDEVWQFLQFWFWGRYSYV